MNDAFRAAVKNVLTSFIGRVVLAVFSLIVLPVLPTVVNFINEVLGYNLTDAQVLGYAHNIAYGIAALAAVWLLNRGLFERAVITGKTVIDTGVEAEAQSEKTLLPPDPEPASSALGLQQRP